MAHTLMLHGKKNIWVFMISIAALAILIFFEPSYGWRMRAWVGSSDPSASRSQTDSQSPAAQNETLQAELAQWQDVAAQLPQNPHDEIRAMVYARYPFGFKSELLVNAGLHEGAAAGSAVTFQGIFIGSVAKAFADSAVVQTVFDPAFKMPVRIGAHGVDALLVGGAAPKATSIARGSAIASGDVVYAAAPGFPYGLAVGIVDATGTSADNLFDDAAIRFAYDVNDVQTVLIGR